MGHCGSQFLTIPHSTWQPGPNRVGVISPLNSCNRQRTAGRRVRWRRGAVANAQWPLRVCVRAVCRVWGDVVIQSSKASSSSTLKILLTQSKSALRTRQAHVTTCTIYTDYLYGRLPLYQIDPSRVLTLHSNVSAAHLQSELPSTRSLAVALPLPLALTQTMTLTWNLTLTLNLTLNLPYYYTPHPSADALA